MSTDRTGAYAQAVVALANAEGALEAVEDELLAVSRAVDGNDELRRQLTDQHLPVGNRLTFAESAALAAAHPATRAALAMIIAADRVGELAAIADEVARQAAERRDAEVAEVYVASPIDDAKRASLKAALEARHRQAARRQGLRRPVGGRRRPRQDRRHGHRRLAGQAPRRPPHAGCPLSTAPTPRTTRR